MGLGAVWAEADRLKDTFNVRLGYPAFQYYQGPADPIARLEKQLENGQAKVDFAPYQEDLTTLLRQLDIDIDSRLPAFSKSSIRTSHISTRPSRAAQFNDYAAVGNYGRDSRLGIIRYNPGAEHRSS